MNELYIGLMSGTSTDGVNAALVDFSQEKPKLISTHFEKMPAALRTEILSLNYPADNEINRLGELDVLLGKLFSHTANQLLTANQLKPSEVRGIGSHGQTIRHYPEKGFSLQIGDPNIIAAETQITTIADFRRRDIALGGQGAPLVPIFHRYVFAKENMNRAVVNIGGIANVTLLPEKFDHIIGFDTGPGNALLDAWTEKVLHKPFDESGEWAKQGKINDELLNVLLADPYFAKKPPKSTGRDYFNLNWLEKKFLSKLPPEDVAATLTELTARNIITAITQHFSTGEIYVCGGGAHNHYLMSRLVFLANHFDVKTTSDCGIDPDWVEAMAFAWLAKQTLTKKNGNLISVTGAKAETILGAVYFV